MMLASDIGIATAEEKDAILATVRAYTAAVYARDYAGAYRWIAAEDRQLKSLADYEQDSGPFTGVSLVLGRRMAQEIVFHDAIVERDGERAKVQAKLSLPHANAEQVSRLLLADDGDAEPPPRELGERMAQLEALIAKGAPPRVEVEGEWMLNRDPDGWRIFLNWSSGIRLRFATEVPKELEVAAAFDRTAVLAPRGETVRLRLTVHNRAAGPVRLKVVHRVEPAALEKRLDLVQCGYLFPREVTAGGVDESPVVYFMDEDVPKDVVHVRVTLAFLVTD